jgi:DNA end-binding protein Ku
VRSKAEIEEAVAETTIEEAELGLAEQLISGLVGGWAPEEFDNDYRRELRTMLEAKLQGEEIKRPEPVAETPVVDLMEALRRSVAEAQGEKKKPAEKARAPKASARRRPPARRSA